MGLSPQTVIKFLIDDCLLPHNGRASYNKARISTHIELARKVYAIINK